MTIHAIYTSNSKPLNFPIQDFMRKTTKVKKKKKNFPEPFGLTTLKNKRFLIFLVLKT